MKKKDWSIIQVDIDAGMSRNELLAKHNLGKKSYERASFLKLIVLRGDPWRSIRIPDEQLFGENANYNWRPLAKREIIKRKLIPYKCDECPIDGTWNSKPITLQLDHKNGVNNDNRLKNLRFLCPNCHSQTDTHGGKNKGKC